MSPTCPMSTSSTPAWYATSMNLSVSAISSSLIECRLIWVMLKIRCTAETCLGGMNDSPCQRIELKERAVKQ